MKTHERSTDPCDAIIHLQGKGGLALSNIYLQIMNGDEVCVDSLMQTISDTMAAKDMRLHIEAVKKLAGKCLIIAGLLSHRNFSQKDRILQAFNDLSHYAGVGIFPGLH